MEIKKSDDVIARVAGSVKRKRDVYATRVNIPSKAQGNSKRDALKTVQRVVKTKNIGQRAGNFCLNK